MTTGAALLRFVRGSSSAVDLDTEDGRAFLQERLAFYNKVCVLISGGFFLVGLALHLGGLHEPEPVSPAQMRLSIAMHAASIGIQLPTAPATRCCGGRPRSSCCGPTGRGRPRSSASSARSSSPRGSRTPTRSRSSTTGARRTGSSTTRSSTSTAPTSTRWCARTARSRRRASSTCCVRWPRRSRQQVFTGATLVEVCSHHLHPRPIPPSERLGRPLPAALEALLLACLEKDPERRPASAAELRRRLGELAQGDPWSEDAARASWERWRERPDRPARPADALSGTLSVSLVDRSG